MSDPTFRLLAEVRRFAVTMGISPAARLRVCITADDGEEIARLLSLPVIAADPPYSRPTGSQLKLVAFLAAGPKLPKQCKDHMGGSLYGRGGALLPLMTAGLVEKCGDGRYRLTEAGEGLAEDLA